METNISLLVFSTPIPLFRRRQKGEMDYLRPLVSVNFQLCPLMDREQGAGRGNRGKSFIV